MIFSKRDLPMVLVHNSFEHSLTLFFYKVQLSKTFHELKKHRYFRSNRYKKYVKESASARRRRSKLAILKNDYKNSNREWLLF